MVVHHAMHKREPDSACNERETCRRLAACVITLFKGCVNKADHAHKQLRHVGVVEGGDAPCLLAKGQLSAAGSLVGALVQLQRVSVPGVLVMIGLACGGAAAASLQDAGVLLGGRNLQVCQDLCVGTQRLMSEARTAREQDMG